MNKTATPEQLIDILADFSGIDANHITLEMPISDLVFDSLDTVEATMALEENFEVDLPVGIIADSATVADLLTIIRNA